MRCSAIVLLGLLGLAGKAPSQTAWTTPSTAEVDAIYPDIEALYIDLHRNPELAFQEVQTAAKLAARVKASLTHCRSKRKPACRSRAKSRSRTRPARQQA